ncbi:protein of unknown function [Streptococcus thermophilus]|uniref:Uncharacterized protein n=1 Tax=Streptococcus thermophilus TaxID=1308 RepID=A0A7U7CAN6_STRTR|nr:protein of unknown function [Streptococcus thermophilus]CAD0143843.1 protein of unknown function [Streptococcus thermophilus]CAD0148279.1 protein of unknown function [Streptococcus thermophilus]CAD0149417.1 protein of unknown function [Streptococcus thermophilus]CAD0151441.1 protein of unknown function [Streptococcus thermophilus]
MPRLSVYSFPLFIYVLAVSDGLFIVLHFLVIFTSFLLSQATQAAPATSIWYFILWLLLITIVLFLIRPKKLETIRHLSN